MWRRIWGRRLTAETVAQALRPQMYQEMFWLECQRYKPSKPIHDNVSDYIAEEICKLDGTFPEQMWCLPELNKALVKKVEVEEQIQLLADEDRVEEQQQLTHEFLVTKTVSNKESS